MLDIDTSLLKTISYSSLDDNRKCGHYFLRKDVQKLSVFTDNIWTHYGTLVHKYVQATLIDKIQRVGASKPWRLIDLESLEPEVAAKRFIRTWFKFCDLYETQLAEQYDKGDPKKLYKNPVRAIMGIREALQEHFGNYTVLRVEEKIKEPTKYPQLFSGYVDVVIQLENGTIVIVDIKTTGTHYMFGKYQDKWKDYQLTLYKNFFCVKHEVDPKNVETYFLTIAKQPSEKEALKLIRVTSGPKKVENALKWMNGVLSAVERGQYVKNRMTCDNLYGKPCPFKNSVHCS